MRFYTLIYNETASTKNMNILKTYFVLALLNIANSSINAQSLKFAFVSDTHIGSATAAEDLRNGGGYK